jgi:hypothetical protein
MPPHKKPDTSALALNVGAGEPAEPQAKPRPQDDRNLHPPQSESEPAPDSIPPGIGHNRGPPQLEPGDVLNGAREIHRYLCELLGREQKLSATYSQLARGEIPARKFGALYIASRRGIAQRLAVGTGLAD